MQGYIVKLNVDVYLHLSNSVLFTIYEKINWNSEKVYLVACSCLLVTSGRLLMVCGRCLF